MAPSAPTESGLPNGIKAAWATGAFGVAILMNGIAALMLFYLVKVLKFDPKVAGFLIFLTKLYDAITDPVTGYLSDRTKAAAGRRRPYLFWGAIVSGVSFVLVFTVPFIGPFEAVWRGPGLTASVYVLVVLLLYTTGYSMFNVPYMAMPAEMTDGYHERSSIHAWRVMFASVGGFLAQSMSGVVLEKLGKDWDAHAAVGGIGGALILITMWVAYFGTSKAPVLPRTERPAPLGEQLAGLARNRPFQQILLIKLVQLLGVSSSAAGLIFYFASVLGLPLTKLPLVGGPMVLTVLVVSPLLVSLSKSVGKRGGYMLSAVMTAVAGLSWVLATPEEPDWALALRGVINGVAFAGNVIFAMSMLTDAMELDFHRTGTRREGMYAALYSFIEKLAAALGPLILGFALSQAGFDPDSPPKEVTQQVRGAVLLAIAYIPTAMAVLAVTILAFYRLDERRLLDIREGRASVDSV